MVATGTQYEKAYAQAFISFPVQPAKKLSLNAGVTLEKCGKAVPTECTIEREGKLIVGSVKEPVAAPGSLCVCEADDEGGKGSLLKLSAAFRS